MKLLRRPYIVVALLIAIACACTANKEQHSGKDADFAETVKKIENAPGPLDQGTFSGEYLIGDGGTFIVPVAGAFEMRNEREETTGVLDFQGKEKDTLSIYANKDKSIIFKMNPGHKSGMYYEPDAQWPVSFVNALRQEESEEEETERIMKQRYAEDSISYSQLAMYGGNYEIKTESEGVNATLNLQYNGDQSFNYEWSFEVDVEQAKCKAKRKGVLVMDRTQHGIDADGECRIHFNFNGYTSKGYIVEIDFEDQSKCGVEGGCDFSGAYATGN